MDHRLLCFTSMKEKITIFSKIMMKKQTILVTGAAGFIGSNFTEIALKKGFKVIAYDALTYAGNIENLEEFKNHSDFHFVEANILDQKKFEETLVKNEVNLIAHFAAESHVDKSINGPEDFMNTNIMGTFRLLSGAKHYFDSLTLEQKKQFKFLHVSTDEVFGSLGPVGKFSETTAYQPNSPYSASKAASDLLVRAWFHTYGLPVVTTNCSNNYGPKQFPEKLIPHMILCALEGKKLPIYGKGENIRDWIHVKDHAEGVLQALLNGTPGETYCFGGNAERTNLKVVHEITNILDELHPRKDGKSYQTQIDFVTDRPGHDLRYAIDDTKAENQLGFKREYTTFEEGLKQTVLWYLSHLDWCKKVSSKPGVKVTYNWEQIKV